MRLNAFLVLQCGNGGDQGPGAVGEGAAHADHVGGAVELGARLGGGLALGGAAEGGAQRHRAALAGVDELDPAAGVGAVSVGVGDPGFGQDQVGSKSTKSPWYSASSSCHITCIARTRSHISRKRDLNTLPWFSISSAFQPAPMPKSKISAIFGWRSRMAVRASRLKRSRSSSFSSI